MYLFMFNAVTIFVPDKYCAEMNTIIDKYIF